MRFSENELNVEKGGMFVYIYIRTVHIVYSESLLHLVTSFTKQYNDT